MKSFINIKKNILIIVQVTIHGNPKEIRLASPILKLL